MRAKFGSDPTAGYKILSFKFISRLAQCFLLFLNVYQSVVIRVVYIFIYGLRNILQGVPESRQCHILHEMIPFLNKQGIIGGI